MQMTAGSSSPKKDSPLIASLPQHPHHPVSTFKLPNVASADATTTTKPSSSSSSSSEAYWSPPSLLAPVLSLFGAGVTSPTPSSCSSEEAAPAGDDDEEEEGDDDEDEGALRRAPARESFFMEDEEEDKIADFTNSSVSTSDIEEEEAAIAPAPAAPAINEFDPILFIALLPCHATALRANLHVSRPHLPQLFPSKPTLVLDLDETLVHCNASSDGQAGTFDIAFEVKFNNVGCQVYVRKRPHLDQFLLHVSQRFEVVVFTASQRVYADSLLDLLDPTGVLIHHRLFRESCVTVSGNLVKDLTVLGRDLRRTMIVDNCPHAFGYQVDNGIPILSWYDDQHDVELLKLQSLLDELHPHEDVRPIISHTFGLRALVDEMKSQVQDPTAVY